MPSLRQISAMLSSPRRQSSTILILVFRRKMTPRRAPDTVHDPFTERRLIGQGICYHLRSFGTTMRRKLSVS